MEYLYNFFRKKVFNINPGLENIKKALKDIGNPEKDFKSILISGTNGKGSTSAFLESLLRNHNLKTGLFTSPHIVDERERWRVNSIPITEKSLKDYVEKLLPVIKKYNLTYFEASALIAFKYFADSKVDIAVLEVGLGGKWDATNVVYPEVSIITNISLDHTHILGDTLEKIAEEKLGISRENRPLIIGSNQEVLISKAFSKGIKDIYHYQKDFSYIKKDHKKFDFIFKEISIKDLIVSLLGDRQIHNASTALAGFLVYSKRRNLSYSVEKIRKAVESVYWPGRMELLEEEPPVILDGAHNIDAIQKTLKEVKGLYPEKKLFILFSGMRDKDWKKISNLLAERGKIYFVELPFSRGLKKEDIKKTKLEIIDTLKDGIEILKEKAKRENGILLITGSLYLAGEVLKIYRSKVKIG